MQLENVYRGTERSSPQIDKIDNIQYLILNYQALREEQNDM